MHKSLILVILIMILLFTLTGQALAAPIDEVTTFGYSDLRNRESNVQGGAMGSRMYHNGGPSYSQPLILNGDHWGGDLTDRHVAVTVENNTMYGYLLPDAKEAMQLMEIKLQPLWSVKLSGSTPTKSHPTFYEKNNKKYIIIGTYSKNIDIIDITNFHNGYLSSSIESNHASDITSAPLIMNWKGHDIIVATSGNTGKVFIIADPFNESKVKDIYINAGSGRTSSSPAPVDGGRAFAVGVDQGQSSGELQIYYLDDVLKEGTSGKLEGTDKPARIVKKIVSGLAASFAAEGNTLYFGDTRSNIYAYDTGSGQSLWWNNKCAGVFSNRSPALTGSMVIFPAVGQGDQSGKLVAVDRNTGRTLWVKEFSSRAQTAPTVINYDGKSEIWEGTSEGWLANINPATGQAIDSIPISAQFGLDQYASGTSGEISVVGNYALITTEEGVVGAFLFKNNLNLQAVNIDPGLPDDNKARPGQTYKGTAIFKYEQGLIDVINMPVGVFYGGQYLKLYNDNGTELPKFTMHNGSTFYYLSLANLGVEYTIHYTWTAGTSNTLRALVNKLSPPVPNVYDEINMDDNEVKTTFDLQQYDIMVEILPAMNPWETNKLPDVVETTIDVTRKDNSGGNLPVKLTVQGPAGSKTFTFNLAPGQYENRPYNFTASSTGNYSIKAEAWPSDGSWTDAHPEDNVDTEVIKVIHYQLLEPTDSKLHVELID